MSRSIPARLCTASATFAVLAATAAAQCGIAWTPTNSLAGVDREVLAAAAWDPDGAGPAGQQLVLGGWFDVAGTERTDGVVFHDPQTDTWSTEGCVLDYVHTLLVGPSGDLYAAGSLPAGPIAVMRYDGSTWTSLGAVFDGPVHALTFAGNGDLFAAGSFVYVGTQPAGGIARFDGTSWSPLGTGMNATVHALATLPNGDVVAGGAFDYVNGVLTQRVARFDGSSWSGLGGVGGIVYDLKTLASGDLIAVGEFGSAGGVAAKHVARFDGTGWSPIGAGIDDPSFPRVNEALEMPNGDLVVVGSFRLPGATGESNVARWDGASWSQIGDGVGTFGLSFYARVNTAAVTPSGELFVAGQIQRAGSAEVANVATWNGSQWRAVGSGLTGNVRAIQPMPDGSAVVAGDFTGPTQPEFLARWDGVSLQPLGAGLPGDVGDLALAPDGTLYAAGRFATAGGAPAGGVARWDGAAWSPLGSGPGVGTSWGVEVLANGDVVAIGRWTTPTGIVSMARWDGQQWLPLASLSGNDTFRAFCVTPNGDLVAVGSFASVDGVAAAHVARFDGTSWHAMGAGLSIWKSGVQQLANGDLYALGLEPRRWNGTSWQPFASMTPVNGGSTTVQMLFELPDGDLLVGGAFGTIDGVAAQRLARWDGVSYSEFAALDGVPWGAAMRADGTLSMFGGFDTVDSFVSPTWIDFASSCPASSTSLGGGCASSGGANTLAARGQPWLGGTFRADATGLPPTGLALGVTGLSGLALPLASVLPSPSGCELLTSVDATELLVIAGGTVTTSLPLPSTPALVGATLRHQVIPFDLDANGTIVSVTSTNALQLVLGDL